MPLLRRLMLLIAGVLLASLAAGGALTYWRAVTKVEVEMAAAVSVVESAVAESLAHIADSKDPESDLARIVAAFDGDRHARTSWLGADDRVIKASRVGLPSDPAPKWLSRLLAEERPAHSFSVLHNGQLLGRIQVEPDAANEVSEVWEDAKLKFVIVGGFCALALALVYYTLGRALKPLDNLSAALERIGEGDYEAHVIEAGPEELSNIYKKFNSMAGKLAEAERQNRRLNEQLQTVQEEERAEIARDLHDEIGPFLFAVDADAQTIPQLLSRGDGGEVTSRVGAIRQSVGHMQMHLRSVLNRLRPATMLDLGLSPAADHLAAFWRARRPKIMFDVDIEDESFGETLDQVAFRVLQEGASNAVRHGAPSRVELGARRDGEGALVVSVTDDGDGFKPKSSRGLGLAGMRERVAMIGGDLAIEAGPDGRGVRLVARLPIGRNEKPPAPAHNARINAA